ncbi:MAG: C40 family peptidase [Chloroflexota bacterium]
MGDGMHRLGRRLLLPFGAVATVIIAATTLGYGTGIASFGLQTTDPATTSQKTTAISKLSVATPETVETRTDGGEALQADTSSADVLPTPQAASPGAGQLTASDNDPARPLLSSRGDRPMSKATQPDAEAEPKAKRADEPTTPSAEKAALVEKATLPIKYTVTDGDTVSDIADRFGISSTTILWANNITGNADSLAIGQDLTILPVSGVLHEVRLGDTVEDIGTLHGVKASAIVDANAISNPDAILVGQRIIVPGGEPLPAPAAVAKVAAAERPAASPPPAQTTSSVGIGSQIVSVASQFDGYAYTWGGHSPSTGFDCTGFTWYVYRQVGLQIPLHDLEGQVAAGPQVARTKLLPGDLVFFQNTYKPGLSHSGIYVGEGRFVHAASENTGVRFDRLDDAYWGPRWYGASRPW